MLLRSGASCLASGGFRQLVTRTRTGPRTTTFFCEDALGQGVSDILTLCPEESKHVQKVQRCQPGDEISVVDGRGGRFRVELATVQTRRAAGRVVATSRDPHGTEIVIALGVLRRRTRWEWFLEKATELGVHTVVPVVTAHCQTTELVSAADRSRRLLVAALKQSQRASLPQITGPIELEAFLGNETARASLPAAGKELRFVCDAGAGDDLFSSLTAHRGESGAGAGVDGRPTRIVLLVGPEGGLSGSETALAQRHGFQAASLGPARLHAETAALTCCALAAVACGV